MKHGITPRNVVRAIEESLSSDYATKQQATAVLNEAATNFDVTETVRELEEEMLAAANNLEFEKAACCATRSRNSSANSARPAARLTRSPPQQRRA